MSHSYVERFFTGNTIPSGAPGNIFPEAVQAWATRPGIARMVTLDQGIRRCVAVAMFHPSNLSCGTAPVSSAVGQLTFTVMDLPAGMEK